MNSKVLVIDDDPDVRLMLKAQLELMNHQVFAAADGREGLRKVFEARPDLVILDVTMPGMDGWEVCRRLRQLSNMPIIMLTARRNETDIVKGLELGADDYITKPFSGAELHARITALLRRSGDNGGHSISRESFYADGHMSIDFDRRLVKVDGAKVDLTPTEFNLLTCLVHHKGRVLPHRYILKEVWGPEYTDQVDFVKLYIRYLRNKIEDDPSNPARILTEWGVGYVFDGI